MKPITAVVTPSGAFVFEEDYESLKASLERYYGYGKTMTAWLLMSTGMCGIMRNLGIDTVLYMYEAGKSFISPGKYKAVSLDKFEAALIAAMRKGEA